MKQFNLNFTDLKFFDGASKKELQLKDTMTSRHHSHPSCISAVCPLCQAGSEAKLKEFSILSQADSRRKIKGFYNG